MKKAFVLVAICLSCFALIAQPVKKKDEKPPTKAEMDAMMKQMQGMMDEMDPETKRMMDSMGIKMPNTKDLQKKMAGITDTQLKTAWEDENRVVPKKDAARIASIPATPLTAAIIPSYITTAHQNISIKIKPAAKAKADEIYATVKANSSSPIAVGNAAAGLWIMGKTQMAIYLMGRACADNPANANQLNNYASMLTMAGMEESAIPMLNYLNNQFPQNSTILNNLGQAWFGLGDIDKAGKYIDSTLRIAAVHPQANATKSVIEESKGNTAGAKEAAIKAAKAGYSGAKEDRLRALNIPVDDKVSDWPFKPENDPLGLSAFKRPDYPMSVAECVALEPVWKAFKQQCSDAIAKLEVQKKTAEEIMQKAQQQRANAVMLQTKMALQNPGFIPRAPVPFFALKANPKYKQLNDYYGVQYDRLMKASVAMNDETAPLKKQYDADMQALRKQDNEQTGEGKPNVDFCPQYQKRSNEFLKQYNTPKQQYDADYLSTMKRQMNEVISIMQYTVWPEEFEVAKLSMKIDWLQRIQDEGFESITSYNCKPGPQGKNVPLAEFDDVACKYHSTMNLIVEKITIDCSRMTTEINTPFLKLGLKQDMNKETFGDQFMNFSAEISASVGPSANVGPLKAEASIGAGVRAEFDRTGMTDLIVKGSATVGAGVELEGKGGGVDIGVEGQISLITGKTSIGGAGLFEK